jgi:hypothetical protein
LKRRIFPFPTITFMNRTEWQTSEVRATLATDYNYKMKYDDKKGKVVPVLNKLSTTL